MTAGWMLLVIGIALLAVALFAGGVPLRAGRARRVPRLAAASVGVLCATAAVILIAGGATSSAPGPLRVSIDNELTEDQLSEEFRVTLDGRHVGVIKVDQRSPKAKLTVVVQRPGRHRYRLQATRVLRGKAPRRQTSHGEVVIERSRALALYADDTGRTYLM